MSARGKMKETERIRSEGPGGFHGAMVAQKSLDFGPSAKRLIGRLRPQVGKVIALLVAGVASVALSSVGPKVLGRATDLIFAGVIGRQLPAGMTKAEAVAAARASGQG
ncbi:MAG TPA: ABC transporter ATP-binding protein, partial [Acidimicrobiia bacterium]|nr:ABC transporter ATP-binding protein [Acidimicrobiia bacterium]